MIPALIATSAIVVWVVWSVCIVSGRATRDEEMDEKIREALAKWGH